MIKINSQSAILNDIFGIYFKQVFDGDPPIILCIGSERATGDALAPLVGSLLRNKYNVNTFVYGTLENTVNAKNIKEVYAFIKERHKNRKILSIDACVGAEQDVGFIKLTRNGLLPRSAIEKTNVSFGDYGILGIVDRAHPDPLKVFTTRLSTVYNLATKISEAINYALTQKQLLKKAT